MNLESIEKAICDQIIDNSNGELAEVDVNKNLEEYGLNSLTFVQLLVGLEDVFDIEFDEEHLKSDVLSTVHLIAEYVKKQLDENE